MILKTIGKMLRSRFQFLTQMETTKNVIKKLVREKVNLNITAIFDYSQVAEILPEIENTKLFYQFLQVGCMIWELMPQKKLKISKLLKKEVKL